MSRHKFFKTLNLDDELDDYDGVAIFEDDDKGEWCVRASQFPLSALPLQN